MKLFDGSIAARLYKKAMEALQHYMEGVYVCICLHLWVLADIPAFQVGLSACSVHVGWM